jgi:hypothetical protein
LRKTQFYRLIFLISVFFTFIINFQVFAHIPPTSGKTDCGTIQGGVFYSEYYSPPSGTPVSAGGCSWTQTSSSRCDVYNYGGQNYNLYPYKFICPMPFDTNSSIFLVTIGVLGFFRLKKYTISSTGISV